jgi:two-component sensor histidine kinase/PAS domain-containing protein
MPIVLLSARAGEESRVEGMESSADDYLIKPFSARELLARVETHVRMARLRNETAESLRASEDRYRAFVTASSDVVYRMGPDWSEMRYLRGKDFIPDTESATQSWLQKYVQPEDQTRVMKAIREAISNKSAFELEHPVIRVDGTIGWTYSRAVPLLGEKGEIIEWFGAARDITERREWEDRQKVLVAELQHRTRNLIAVVRSIAAQTMAMTGPTEAFRNEFNDRLEALARVQALLSRSDETPITLERLIRVELDALGALDETNGRITLQGPSVRLRSSIVQTLSLVLHELATNARKHGALSDGDGHLSVTWRLHQAAEGQRLGLEWIETMAGMRIDPSCARRGYGRELIEQALPYALGAITTYELSAGGARCMIDMPLERPLRRAL